MIQLGMLSAGSDVVASASLAVLALIFGLLPAERVTPMYLRKRREIALILAVACLHRLAERAGAPAPAFALHIASAVVACLSASAAVVPMLGVRRHGP